MTAKLYRSGIKLEDLYNSSKEEYDFIEYVDPIAILKVISLLSNRDPRRSNLFKLEADNFENNWRESCELLERAFIRLTDLKNGYGVIDFKRWNPYSTLVVPLAIMLKEADKSGNYSFYKKIDIWYWINVFSQRYDKSVDSQTFSDIKSMKDWFLDNSKIPDLINKFNVEHLDLDIDKQNNAIYKGIINLIILSGAFNFKTGQAPQFDLKRLQDGHIFPKSIYNENSILIRTVITSNQSKFNKIPSKFLVNYYIYMEKKNY